MHLWYDVLMQIWKTNSWFWSLMLDFHGTEKCFTTWTVEMVIASSVFGFFDRGYHHITSHAMHLGQFRSVFSFVTILNNWTRYTSSLTCVKPFRTMKMYNIWARGKESLCFVDDKYCRHLRVNICRPGQATMYSFYPCLQLLPVLNKTNLK